MKRNIFSDIEFTMGSFVLICGCIALFKVNYPINLLLGIPFILISFLAFYLGYLCLDK